MLSAQQICVWTADLEEIPKVLRPQPVRCLNLLAWARAARFLAERHRRQHIAAHALKRVMLTALCAGETSPTDWRFECSTCGKTRLHGLSDLACNISHTEGVAACALSRKGVDIERIERNFSLKVAHKCLAATGRKWLQSLF
jgi:4'-phosphopantetheinyl transferase